MAIRDLVGSSFYKTKYYKSGSSYMLDVILSTTLELMNYFDNLFFLGDSSRVVYATNAYAFRARSQSLRGQENSDLQPNDLSFPFMNFSVRQGGVSLADSVLYSNYQLKSSGVYIEELNKKAKLYPIVINFEGTYFTTQMVDAHIVTSRAFEQGALETVLKPSIWYKGQEISNIAKVKFDDIVLDDQYNEADWLEKNRIHTVGFSLSVYTYLVDFYPGIFTGEDKPPFGSGDPDKDEDPSISGFNIPKKILLYYAMRNNLEGWNGKDYDGLLQGVIDHLDQAVYWHDRLMSPKIIVNFGRFPRPSFETYKGKVYAPIIEVKEK